MFGYLAKYLHNMMQLSIQHPPAKLICNPDLCSYTPHIYNGPCRFCYGNKIKY